jgi:hypothetical protein
MEAAVAGEEPHSAANTVQARVVLMARPPLIFLHALVEHVKYILGNPASRQKLRHQDEHGAMIWFMLVPQVNAVMPRWDI